MSIRHRAQSTPRHRDAIQSRSGEARTNTPEQRRTRKRSTAERRDPGEPHNYARAGAYVRIRRMSKRRHSPVEERATLNLELGLNTDTLTLEIIRRVDPNKEET